MFWRKRYPYSVLMHLNGRHPYLKGPELDYPTRDIVVVVHARDWCDAEKQAFRNVPRDKPFWSAHVRTITRGDIIKRLSGNIQESK